MGEDTNGDAAILKVALCTLFSTRGATAGEILSRFPADSHGETGEPGHAAIAAAVGRSPEDRPILVESGRKANQEDSSSRNKDGDDTPHLLVLSPTSV